MVFITRSPLHLSSSEHQGRYNPKSTITHVPIYATLFKNLKISLIGVLSLIPLNLFSYQSVSSMGNDWSQWEEWSRFDVTCGSQTRFRNRKCLAKIPFLKCFGEDKSQQNIFQQPCRESSFCFIINKTVYSLVPQAIPLVYLFFADVNVFTNNREVKQTFLDDARHCTAS